MRRLLSSRLFPVALALFGLLMMGFGLYRGELTTVFKKAVTVCLECIGIG